MAKPEEEDIIRVNTHGILGKQETIPHNSVKLCLFFLRNEAKKTILFLDLFL